MHIIANCEACASSGGASPGALAWGPGAALGVVNCGLVIYGLTDRPFTQALELLNRAKQLISANVKVCACEDAWVSDAVQISDDGCVSDDVCLYP